MFSPFVGDILRDRAMVVLVVMSVYSPTGIGGNIDGNANEHEAAALAGAFYPALTPGCIPGVGS